jgi:hypothetical protein
MDDKKLGRGLRNFIVGTILLFYCLTIINLFINFEEQIMEDKKTIKSLRKIVEDKDRQIDLFKRICAIYECRLRDLQAEIKQVPKTLH